MVEGGISMNDQAAEKTIETERLMLRLFTEADAPEVSALCNNFALYKST